MEHPKVNEKIDMEAHVFNHEVGLRDIVSGQDSSKFDNLHVHFAKCDIISEYYSWHDIPLGHITHHDFESKHAGQTHSISNFIDLNLDD